MNEKARDVHRVITTGIDSGLHNRTGESAFQAFSQSSNHCRISNYREDMGDTTSVRRDTYGSRRSIFGPNTNLIECLNSCIQYLSLVVANLMGSANCEMKMPIALTICR